MGSDAVWALGAVDGTVCMSPNVTTENERTGDALVRHLTSSQGVVPDWEKRTKYDTLLSMMGFCKIK